MFLDLTDILREAGKSVRREFTLEPAQVQEMEVLAPVTGWVSAANARQNLIVKGQAQAQVELQCARCLRLFAQDIEVELQTSAPVHRLRAELDGASHAAEEDGEDDFDEDEFAALFHDHRLDVAELVRQAIVLQLPPKPLCSDDCAGLPEAAQYVESGPDARWEGLAQWKDAHPQ